MPYSRIFLLSLLIAVTACHRKTYKPVPKHETADKIVAQHYYGYEKCLKDSMVQESAQMASAQTLDYALYKNVTEPCRGHLAQADQVMQQARYDLPKILVLRDIVRKTTETNIKRYAPRLAALSLTETLNSYEAQRSIEAQAFAQAAQNLAVQQVTARAESLMPQLGLGQ